MQNRRTYRIVMTIACFVFAGLIGYRILQGAYSSIDVFLLVVFLVFGAIYSVILMRGRKDT